MNITENSSDEELADALDVIARNLDLPEAARLFIDRTLGNFEAFGYFAPRDRFTDDEAARRGVSMNAEARDRLLTLIQCRIDQALELDTFPRDPGPGCETCLTIPAGTDCPDCGQASIPFGAAPETLTSEI